MPVARSVEPHELDRAGEVGFIAFGGTLEEWQQAHHQHVDAFGPEKVLVVEHEGTVVSSMFIIPEGMHLGDSVVPSAAVGGVATVPEARRLGCAAAMMHETVRRMRADGVATSAMWPFSFSYYRKFGWEAGGEIRVLRIPRDTEFRVEALGSAAPAGPGDLDDIARVWDSTAPHHRCATQRVTSNWEWHLKADQFGGAREDRAGFVYRENGAVLGYLFYTVPELKEGEEVRPVEIQELRAISHQAQVGLLRALMGHVDRETFEVGVSVADPLRSLAVNPRAIETFLHANFGFRVIDPGQIFPTMRTDAAQAPVNITVDDVLLGPRSWRLAFAGGGVEAEEVPTEGDTRCTIQTFSQIASGLLKPLSAASAGLLTGPANAVAALEAATAHWNLPYRSGLERG
ncbi:MAG TPA: GNAT family N-acetyltransferase [Armatimonadota bacterium]|jgi:predicted acetyltransferase